MTVGPNQLTARATANMNFFFAVIRPNFGCRKYITKVIYKLIPALKNDLGDWLVETRIKTSQLTYLLVCHMEETSVITQHADTLLSLFFHGVKDDETVVMKNVRKLHSNM